MTAYKLLWFNPFLLININSYVLLWQCHNKSICVMCSHNILHFFIRILNHNEMGRELNKKTIKVLYPGGNNCIYCNHIISCTCLKISYPLVHLIWTCYPVWNSWVSESHWGAQALIKRSQAELKILVSFPYLHGICPVLLIHKLRVKQRNGFT